ncbi:hypothetical protein [Catellatospora sp. NPDC049133]|uniref:hypothetical protein n=1 Tax=Catellatospora sp. NPDC049133 TaxID=3155499 RepID=UPI0033D77BC1
MTGLTPVLICPGIGKDTRPAGVVYGTEPKAQPGPVRPDERRIMEWQWAQGAMFAHYYADFLRTHPTFGFVLAEAAYASLLTGVDAVDVMFGELAQDFRRDHKARGLLRPDILGVSVTPHANRYRVDVEILEVTTLTQAQKTHREDVLYKLGKLREVLTARDFLIRQTLSAQKLEFSIGPSPWRPVEYWKRIVVLPLRPREDGKRCVEWICFQPTFIEGNPLGLLLYEIHSIPLEDSRIPKPVLDKLAEQERDERQRQAVPYGQTLTPWLTPQYLNNRLLDRQQMEALAIASGVGMLAVLGIFAIEAVAGMAFLQVASQACTVAPEGPGIVRIAPQVLRLLADALRSTMQTANQWYTVLGGRLAVPAP